MHILILGGSGVVSTGITTHCLSLGYKVTVFNRGSVSPPDGANLLKGDRYNLKDLNMAAKLKPDVVIDMLCFQAEHSALLTQAFSGKTQQVIMCSTACVYDLKSNHRENLISEHCAVHSHWHYGLSKSSAEQTLIQAARSQAFELTIFRPSHIYDSLHPIHQLGLNGEVLFHRIANKLPVYILDEGQANWQALHQVDAGKAFALACLNPSCFNSAFNLGGVERFNWLSYYLSVSKVIGEPPILFTIDSSELDNPPFSASPELEFSKNVSRFDFAVSPNKFVETTGFAPSIPLEKGLSQIWQNLKTDTVVTPYPNIVSKLGEKARPVEFK